jgi:hypothetical protein
VVEDCSWDAPFVSMVRLPPPFNLPGEGGSLNDSLWLSADGLQAFLSRSVGGNDYDVYHTSRATMLGSFDQPTALAAIRTSGRERQVSLSEDALKLVYQNDKSVFMTHRYGTSEEFEKAGALSGLVNEPGTVTGEPSLNATADRLYFSANRGGLDFGIYVVEMSGLEPHGHATKVVDHSNAYDGSPTASADELTLYYQTGTPAQVWVAHRSRVTDPFAENMRVESLAAPDAQFPEAITADGCTLLYGRQIALTIEWFEARKR